MSVAGVGVQPSGYRTLYPISGEVKAFFSGGIATGDGAGETDPAAETCAALGETAEAAAQLLIVTRMQMARSELGRLICGVYARPEATSRTYRVTRWKAAYVTTTVTVVVRVNPPPLAVIVIV